jgi:putative FmdB family regulatory protein
MPIYEYECGRCGHQFEMLVLKGTVAACPSCKSKKLEQLLSSFAVSSEERTRANVKAARQMYAASKDYKDQKIAEADEIREHSPVQEPPRPKPKSRVGRSPSRKK